MTKNLSLKTCVVCGLEKPLSAFLQINGPEGTSYGTVCSTCRGSGLGTKVVLPTDAGEQSSSATGIKIDAKTKVQIEKDNRELFSKAQEEHHTNLDERLAETKEKTDLEIQKAEDLKKRLGDGTSEKTKSSFLNYKTKRVDDYKQTGAISEQEQQAKVAAGIEQTTQERQAREAGSQAELRKTTEDFSVQVLDQHTLLMSRDNEFYKAWETWMGDNAATRTTRRQLSGKTFLTTQSAKPSQEKTGADLVKETWNSEANQPNPPNTRGRR